MAYTVLKELLPHLDAYEQQTGAGATMAGFLAWMQLQEAPEFVQQTPGMDLYTSISKHLFFMVRYARFYGKKALEGTPLNNLDDFVYLVTLQFGGPKGKSELIQMNRQEKPTGMEIIRRLTQQGFVRQFDDPSDRRSRKLAITPEGSAVVFALYERMDQIGKIVAADLSVAELQQLHHLLLKLEHFHQQLQTKGRDQAFEGVLSEHGRMVGSVGGA